MKKIIVYSLSLIFSISSFAQIRCGTDIYMSNLFDKYPSYKIAREKVDFQINDWIINNPNNGPKNIITIPVVVHVVWNTNAENISDAQIFSQIDVLNDDFRRTNSDASNTPAVWQSVAADCEIDFCLATVDPNGNSTTGITRTQTAQTSFSINNDGVKSASSGGINPWNQDDYLNIWVCDLSGGILGYATPPSNFNNPNDGVVIGYRYFGTTGVVQSPYNKGRTATHEVGHWLNLDHIWGDSYCGNDQVNDTPKQQESNYGNPNFPHNPNSCNTSNASGDMFMNYMDYTNDGAMNMFTDGQKSRMIAAINQYRQDLLNHNLCSGGTNPTSWNCINGSCVDPGDGTGTYASFNTCFSDCECSGTTASIMEGFQSGSIPNDWSTDNPDGSETWVVNTNYGYNSNSSVFIENSIYAANGQYDDLNSPVMNFSNATTVSLSFDYAYSLWTNPNAAQNWSDTLIILVSNDCGLTWQNVWEKAGPDLVTTNPVFNEFEWFPNNNNDWKSESINLNNYINQDGIIIKFRNVNQYENNLFIDNINIISDGTANIIQEIDNTISVYPNPTDGYCYVDYNGLKEIYSILGEKIITTYDKNINLANLSQGVYLIKVDGLIIRLIRE